MLHVRICAGGAGQPASLPRQNSAKWDRQIDPVGHELDGSRCWAGGTEVPGFSVLRSCALNDDLHVALSTEFSNPSKNRLSCAASTWTEFHIPDSRIRADPQY